MFPQFPKGSNISSFSRFPSFAVLLYSCAWFSTNDNWKNFIKDEISNLTEMHSTFTAEQVSFCTTLLTPDQQDRLNVITSCLTFVGQFLKLM